jgi:putative FmdB family regulatory protein
MPLYEYICMECSAEFEKLVIKKNEAVALQCPVCGSKKLEEKISGFCSLSGEGSTGASNCAPSSG